MTAEARHESSWARATWALMYYVVIPTIVITAIMWRFPELSQERFMVTLRWVLVLGILLVGINALRAEHEVGTYWRLGLDTAFVLAAIGWLLGVLGGGVVLEQTWKGHPFSIDISGLFVLIVLLASLNLIHDTLRFAQARGWFVKEEPTAPADPEAPGVTIEYVEDSPAL